MTLYVPKWISPDHIKSSNWENQIIPEYWYWIWSFSSHGKVANEIQSWKEGAEKKKGNLPKLVDSNIAKKFSDWADPSVLKLDKSSPWNCLSNIAMEREMGRSTQPSSTEGFRHAWHGIMVCYNMVSQNPYQHHQGSVQEG